MSTTRSFTLHENHTSLIDAAIIDEHGNEVPITDEMILAACKELEPYSIVIPMEESNDQWEGC